MQASRILPDLQCSLMCDDIRREANGNFCVLGILNCIAVPQLPVTAFRLFVFNRWTAGVGNFVETVRLLAPDQTTVLRKGEVKFTLPDASSNSTSAVPFMQVEFKAPGNYFVEVLVDDVMKLRYAVPVVLVQQPNTTTQPPAPGA